MMLNLKHFISQKTGRTIVMSEDKYVFFDNLEEVNQEIVQECTIELELAKEEEIKLQELQEWKAQRTEKVQNIKVTYKEVQYQGDETSQDRMNRAITALPDDITTVNWVADDNSIQELTKLDLVEILRLSSIELARIWVEGRPE